MAQKKSEGRVVIGGLFILFGVLFLLDNFYYLNVRYVLSTFWPTVLIILGAGKMIRVRSINDNGAIFLLIAGAFFQLIELHYLYWWQIERYWPVSLILIGVWILIAKRSKPAVTDLNTQK